MSLLISVKSSTARQLFRLPLPVSSITPQITLTTVAGNIALGSITIAGLPSGATVQHLFMHVKYGERSNDNAAVNSISGAQNIQAKKGAGAFSTGIAFVGGEKSTPASSVGGGDVFMGTNDLVSLAPANTDVITFQWTSALAAKNNLYFNDVQVVLDLWYSV
jgi:hypothetical protein